MTDFILHPTLEKDSLHIRDFETTTLRLINNAHVIWCVVVPVQNDVIHFTDLSSDAQDNLMSDVRAVSSALQQICNPDRLNIGMLGNIVSQMHWHIVARHSNDPVWPDPVWGRLSQMPYDGDVADALILKINNVLDNL